MRENSLIAYEEEISRNTRRRMDRKGSERRVERLLKDLEGRKEGRSYKNTEER